MYQKRINEYGITVGSLPRGQRNKITDVEGVQVGHCTIDNGENKTGVTVILPGPGNLFTDKMPAASFVWNGFGKTAGLLQVDELGTLETPIALTNTLNVGLVHDALVEYTLEQCEKDGVEMRSLNRWWANATTAGSTASAIGPWGKRKSLPPSKMRRWILTKGMWGPERAPSAMG